MAENLSDALRGLHAAHESSAAATPAGPALELDVVTRRVRRRRAARAVGTGAVTVVLVGAVAAGAAASRSTWWAPQPAATAPAPTAPAPTAPDPTPSGTPTADDDQDAAVTSSPYLPAADPLPDGLLEQTDATWSLVSYASRDGGHPDVLYLVGPDGHLFEVPSAVGAGPAAGDGTGSRLGGWLPGTSLALEWTDADTGTGEGTAVRVVDLLSGETVGAVQATGAVHAAVRFVGDGTSDVLVEMWSPERHLVERIFRASFDGTVRAELVDQNVTDVVVEPGGARLALLGPTGVRVLDTATMSPTWSVAADAGLGECYQGAWDAAGSLVATCRTEPDGVARYWLLGDGTAPRLIGTAGSGDGTLTPPGESLSPVLHLGDLTVLGDGTAGHFGITMWLLGPDATVSPLPPVPSVAGCTDVAVDGRFACLITSYSGPAGEDPHDQLVALDPLTGDRRVLLDVVDPARSSLGLVPIAW